MHHSQLPGAAMHNLNISAQGANAANPNQPTSPAPGAAADEEEATKVKKEKDKDKFTRLVYSDNELSPEEKMVNLPRYAFTPSRDQEMVLGEATTAAVTGVAGDSHGLQS